MGPDKGSEAEGLLPIADYLNERCERLAVISAVKAPLLLPAVNRANANNEFFHDGDLSQLSFARESLRYFF